jgi:hypothetical protein
MVPTGTMLKLNGGGLVYPMINNIESPVTLVTFYFDAQGKVTLVKCNKFDVPKENNPSYQLPPEFYLFVDIYYPGRIIELLPISDPYYLGTTCTLYGDFKYDLYKKYKCYTKAEMSIYYKDQI